MRRRLPAAVLFIALLLACRYTPAGVLAASSPVQPTSLESLQQRLDQLLADPALGAATWGVSVHSLATHEVLFESQAHRLLTPASTLKTITLAAAADQLGWDFSYDTRVALRGTVVNGVLEGDVIVIGSGDPSFDDWDGAASAVFRTWAERLKELGIAAVAGRIVGDDRVFADDGFGTGWMWDDMSHAYSAPASGLQFNEGAAQLVVIPGPSVGAEATLRLTPAYATVALQGVVLTDVAGSPSTLITAPAPRSTEVRVSGAVPIDGGRHVRTVAVAHPTQYFVNAVREGLESNGIAVRGGAVGIDDVAGLPAIDSLPVLLTHRSPLLSSLADTLMKLSQNLFAESLLRTVGQAYSGTGTADAGLTAIREILAGWDVEPSEVMMSDGSGLSRYNLVTAGALVSVLTHVADTDWLRDPYVASLPVAGRTGTLATRMKGTAAEGNVRAKTGSFANARSIAGFLRSADREPLAFAVIANNYGAQSEAVDRATDELLVSLAEFRR